MTSTNTGRTRGRTARRGRRWRFSTLSLVLAVLMQLGLSLVLYPSAAAWVSQYNQSHIVSDQLAANAQAAEAELASALADARQYNDLLQSGAIYSEGANIAEGTGIADTDGGTGEGTDLDYWNLLNASPTGTMGRLLIPSIDLDLPIYHGTSDATLLKGVGHLEGTSLPVGGEGTRSVLTGHRGLANATMFTNLDQVEEGDSIIIEVFGEVLTYEVVDIEVVDPDATEEIRAEPGRDLVTLVTCTPLGVNTQRILITGERVAPTPADDVATALSDPDVPGFAWWAVIYAAGTAIIWTVFWRSGYAGTRGRGRGGHRGDRHRRPRYLRTPRYHRQGNANASRRSHRLALRRARRDAVAPCDPPLPPLSGAPEVALRFRPPGQTPPWK